MLLCLPHFPFSHFFEFIFYFDLDCDIKQKPVQNLIAELDKAAIQFTFLGAYSEM